MLKEAAPGVARVALMFNPDTAPHYYVYLRSFEAVPRSIAVEVTAAPVRDTAEVEKVLAKLGRDPGGGLIVAPDVFTILHYPLFITLAQQHRLPAVYAYRTYVAEGALMSYGPDPYDNFRRSASYSIASSREPSRPIFPFSSQRSLNWPSTSRPPRRWASKFLTSCSRWPTR